MKVTKLIREFVEEEVNKAIPTEHLCPAYEAMLKTMDDKRKALEEELSRLIEIRCKEAATKIHLPADWDFKPAGYRLIDTGHYYSALDSENRQLKEEAENRRKKVIKSILLDMELGEVNKKNLTEAIAKAVVES